MSGAPPNPLSLSSLPADRVLDSAPDGILIVDSEGTIQYANAQLRALFGYPRDELVGKAIELLIPANLRALHLAHRERYFSDPRSRPMGTGMELRGQRRDGTEVPVEISLSPLRSGNDLWVMCAIRDVTERRALEDQVRQAADRILKEEALKKSHEELEARVAERTRELEAAKNEATQANAVKSRFLAAASHDLRQPLQTIWSLQAALARAFNDTDYAPHIALLAEAVRNMDQMLSALIDINRLEQGAIHPVIRDFSLAEILPGLRSEFAYAAASKSLMLEIDPSAHVARTDPMLLPVVLRNLLGNAIKYTQQGAIRLRVRTDGAQLLIDVTDTGPGIPPEHVQRLFEAFYQVNNPTRDQRRGVGLGLSIVQTVCRLLGHSISVDSQVGRGTTFTVGLTRGVAIVAAPEAAAPLANASGRRAGTVTVLHIEDDPGVARSMALLLRLEGYEVIAAATREEALQQITRHGVRPDLILCDFNLPMGFTGDEIVSEIAIFLGFKPPTIILTGDIADKHVKRAKLVADRILPKPVDIDQLLKTINTLLETHEEPRAAFDTSAGIVPLAERCDPAFAELLTPSHLAMLEDHAHAVYGVWRDLSLAYMNPAWYAFAKRNDGDGLLNGPWTLGRSTWDAVPACLHAWYASLFPLLSDEAAEFKQADYECSSAEYYRRFVMKIFPLTGAKRQGFVIITSLRFEVPHVASDRKPCPPQIALYTDGLGEIHQCANCRRVQLIADPASWNWVPDWIRQPPAAVSHVLCPKCRPLFYPAAVDTVQGTPL